MCSSYVVDAVCVVCVHWTPYSICTSHGEQPLCNYCTQKLNFYYIREKTWRWPTEVETCYFKVHLLLPLKLLYLNNNNNNNNVQHNLYFYLWIISVRRPKRHTQFITVVLTLSKCWLSRSGGPLGKHFLTVIVLHLLWIKFSPQLSDVYKEICINVLFVRK